MYGISFALEVKEDNLRDSRALVIDPVEPSFVFIMVLGKKMYTTVPPPSFEAASSVNRWC